MKRTNNRRTDNGEFIAVTGMSHAGFKPSCDMLFVCEKFNKKAGIECLIITGRNGRRKDHVF